MRRVALPFSLDVFLTRFEADIDDASARICMPISAEQNIDVEVFYMARVFKNPRNSRHIR